MKKIRINELARDLEVKANLILDKLPDFGVTEKKTHSSSVDENVAEKLRDFFVGGDSGRGSGGNSGTGERSHFNGTHSRNSHEGASEARMVEQKSSATALEDPPAASSTTSVSDAAREEMKAGNAAEESGASSP